MHVNVMSVIFRQIEKYFKFVLIFNMVNINRYNLYKQRLFGGPQ